MAEKNVGKKHGLGVTHKGSWAKGGSHKFISGSQKKAMRSRGRGAQTR